MGRKQRYTREDSINKAMQLFWKKGYDGTSMKDLEICLDMRPGSIYASFGNKEHFYLEAMAFYVQQSISDIQQQFEQKGFYDGIKFFIKSRLDDSVTPSACMLGKTVSDGVPENTALKAQAGDVLLQFEVLLNNEMIKAIDKGEIPQSVNKTLLAKFINVQILGLRCYAQIAQDSSVLGSILDESMAAIKGIA